MTTPKEDDEPMEAPAIDPGEKRWEQNVLAGRQVAGGTIQAINATATPLDAYRHAKVITARQFDAGNSLRYHWTKAGREPRVVAVLDGVGGGRSEMSDAQSRAWARFAKKIGRLDPLAGSCVWNVCCMGLGAEAWASRNGKPAHTGLVTLKAGLDVLSGKEK